MAARDLSALQAGLARALARARAGEDRELHQKLRDRGDALAQVLAALFRTTRMHAADNRAFDAPIAELVRVLAEVVELLGAVRVVAVEDQVYLNDVRVRSEVKGADLGAELARHNAGGLTFHAALDEAQVRALVAAFARKPAPEAPRRALQAALDAAGVGCVQATPRYRFRTRSTPEQDGGDPVEVMRRTLRLVDDTFEHVSLGRVLNPLPLRRSVAEVMAVGAGAPELWETLASGTPLANHAATVMLTSLLVGRAAGISRAALQDLGVAALLHDVGYAAVPPEEVATPLGLGRHPGEGARLLLRQRGFHDAKLRRLRAVLDHHEDHAAPRGRPSGQGEILRLAEDYATLVRVYGARVSPSDALGAMARAAGTFYHPALTQLLVNVLGRWPPGTLLELADGRFARVVAPARSPETFAAPLVRFYDPAERTLSPDRHDLAEGPAVRRALPG